MSRQPNDPNIEFQRAIRLHESGSIQEAIQIYQSLWQRFPKNTMVLFYLGIAECQIREFDKGAQHLARFIKDNPRNAAAYNNRGNALMELKRFDEAEICFNRAVQLNPKDADIFLNRAELYRHKGQRILALENINQCINLDASGDGHVNRSKLFEELGRLEEALSDIRYALALRPNEPQFHFNHARLLALSGEREAALTAYDHSLKLNPNFIEALNNRGNLLISMGRLDDGLASFDEAILQTDNDPIRKNEALWNKSNSLLLKGEYLEGWELYEARWLKGRHSFPQRFFSKPLWLGETEISGSTLLVYAEQGLGDTIQFCRYLPLLKEKGVKVIFEVQKPLVSLMKQLPNVSEVIAAGRELPEFDYQIPLMSLPLVFETTVTSIPTSIPYLYSDTDTVKNWGDRFKKNVTTTLRIGLIWSGGFRPNQPNIWEVNARRNIPLQLLSILAIPQCEFVSLQKGPDAVAQLRDLENDNWDGPQIIDFTEDIEDFSDTAALIEHLDLVISVDTSTAHLAAAMGKPVWLMNRYDTCWRWMLERADTPWYPTMRIFRQPNPGDWGSVVTEIREALLRLLVERTN